MGITNCWVKTIFILIYLDLTLAGIEPATFRFVAQHLNHCATAVPLIGTYNIY